MVVQAREFQPRGAAMLHSRRRGSNQYRQKWGKLCAMFEADYTPSQGLRGPTAAPQSLNFRAPSGIRCAVVGDIELQRRDGIVLSGEDDGDDDARARGSGRIGDGHLRGKRRHRA